MSATPGLPLDLAHYFRDLPDPRHPDYRDHLLLDAEQAVPVGGGEGAEAGSMAEHLVSVVPPEHLGVKIALRP